MANYMNSQKKRGPKQRDLSLDGLNYVDLGSSKVCVSLPLKLMIGWTDGTSLEAPRLELGRAFVGRMMVTLYQRFDEIVSQESFRQFIKPEQEHQTPAGGYAPAIIMDQQSKDHPPKCHIRSMMYKKDKETGELGWFHTSHGTALLEEEVDIFLGKMATIVTKMMPASLSNYKREFIITYAKDLAADNDYKMQEIEVAVNDARKDGELIRKIMKAAEDSDDVRFGRIAAQEFVDDYAELIRNIAFGHVIERMMAAELEKNNADREGSVSELGPAAKKARFETCF